jgi:hypothetical protein
MPRRARPVQPDLLDWQAPQAYPAEAVRAATVAGRISRAVAFTLRHCGVKRQDIAARMAAYLGEPVSPAMLDAYASQAREDHNISAVRLLALAHATGDVRLLDMLCEPLGFAVIDRRLLPMLELADTHEQIETLRRRQDGIRRLLRDGAR